jgi:hypothetical protein
MGYVGGMAQVNVDDGVLNRVCVLVTSSLGRSATRVEAVEAALYEYLATHDVKDGVTRGETAATAPTTERK